MLNSLLHCDDLNINFGQNQVIKNLHMHLYEGEILSILGPSGCGKTTLPVSYTHLTLPTNREV